MKISVLSELGRSARTERRVALTPRATGQIVALGHDVIVERGAGGAAGFADDEYEAAGARIAHRRIEALVRADLLVGVRWLDPFETSVVQQGAIALAVHRLDVAAAEIRKAYREGGIISIGGDRLTDERGRHPILERMSELGGALAPQIATRMLESTAPGRPGVLMYRLPGVAPAEVVIIGAGTLGTEATRRFAALGVNVHLLDRDLWRLHDLAPTLPMNVTTLVATPETIDKVVRFANVLVTAIRTPGRRPEVVVSEEQVRQMRPGAAILDFSIDEGGAVATARPIWDPADAYQVHGVTHFCMPNTPSLVARSASRMLSQVYLPYVIKLAEGANPTAHPTFAPAVWWGDDPVEEGPVVGTIAAMPPRDEEELL